MNVLCPQEHRREQEAGEQSRPSRDEERDDGEAPRSDPVVLVQEAQPGYLAKSLMRSTLVSAYLSHRIHPTWLHQNPRSGEWMSSSVSESRWWSRWCAAHHSAPFCAAGPAAERQDELEHPAGPVAAVCEVAVVAGGDEPLATEQEHHGERDGLGGHPEDEQAGNGHHVHQDERDRRDLVIFSSGARVYAVRDTRGCGGRLGAGSRSAGAV